MSKQERQDEPGNIGQAVSIERWSAERHLRGRGQGRTRSRRLGASARAHPLEFDAGGFPVAQRSAGFGERVARLLTPP